MPVSSGIPAPEFSLPDETETVRSLSEFRGHPVILYFYPDDYSQYTNTSITILGVSPDSSKSHAKFKAKYGLPFPLLADTEHKVCELYKVWGLKKAMGREYMGVFRTTYLIDENGKIIHVFENVKPAGHSAEILSKLNISN
jgi:peroxiredoxin Q/BCP